MSSGWPQEDAGHQWLPAWQMTASPDTRDYPPHRPEETGGGRGSGYGSPYWPDDDGAAWRQSTAPVTSWDLTAFREPADGMAAYREGRPRPSGYQGDAGGTGHRPGKHGGPVQPGYGGSAGSGYGVADHQDAGHPAAYQPAGYGDDHGGRGRHGRHGGYAPSGEPGYEQAGYQDGGVGYGVSNGYGYRDAGDAAVSLQLPHDAASGYPMRQPMAGDHDPGQLSAWDSGQLAAWDSGQLAAQRLPAGDLASGALAAGESALPGDFPAGGQLLASQELGGGHTEMLDDVPADGSLAGELASGEFPTSQFNVSGLETGEPGTAATGLLDRRAPAAPRAPGRRGGRGERPVIQRPPAAPAAGDRGSGTGGRAATTTTWFQAVRDGGKPPGKRRGRSGDRRLWIALGGLAVVAVASAMAIVTYVLPSGPGGPAHTLVTPLRLGSYLRRPSLEQQMNVDQLLKNFRTMSSGGVSHVVEAVYEAGTSASAKPPQILMFIGGNVAYASPSASLSGFLQRAQGATATSPGSLGGKAACVSASAAQLGTPGGMAICTWFDNDTVGELISPTMNATALAQTMRSVRPHLELAASKLQLVVPKKK